jgi:1-acyl-sn-glycerol-3-phosphate acyltransferase
MSKHTFLQIIRLIARAFLRVIARLEVIGSLDFPPGGCIIATNHLGRLEAFLAIILPDRDDMVLLIAEKYHKYAIWRYFARKIDGIWLNRHDVDFHALRAVYKRIQQGEILAIAPEGTRSPTEALLPGKPGAAFLAAKSGVPVIPLAVWGTEDRVVKERLRRLKRLDVTIHVGRPFRLPPMDRQDRDIYLQAQTDEIMCQIAALLPPKYRGVYADHPRLKEILAEQRQNPGGPPAARPGQSSPDSKLRPGPASAEST